MTTPKFEILVDPDKDGFAIYNILRSVLPMMIIDSLGSSFFEKKLVDEIESAMKLTRIKLNSHSLVTT